MRIGFEVSPILRTRTGIGNYTYHLLHHLLNTPGDQEFIAFSSGRAPIDIEGLPKLATHRHLPLPTSLLYQAWSSFARPHVDTWLGGVDLYHATNYFLPPVRSAARVLTIYDLAFLKSPAWCNQKTVAPFAKQIHRAATDADAILTCSKSAKRDIVDLLQVEPEKVTVAYGAVDDDFTPIPSEKARTLVKERYGVSENYFLFVGTLEPRKNIIGLLQAYARAAKAIPHALVLIGRASTAYDAEIDALLGDLGIRARVHRIGYVANSSELPACYSGATAFILPSFDEGFGLPILEAMACGTPVIASDCASLPEVGGEAARYVAPEDTDALAHTMQEVATDEDLQQMMRRLGHAQAKKFTWSECANQTMKVYRQILGQ